jgi:LmbE family N-acetylglucosaminyl deacetylase
MIERTNTSSHPSDLPLPKRLVGIWAHPDDEAYLSAALMARVIDSGGSVRLVCATDGEGGFGPHDHRELATRAAQRRSELVRAMATIGVHDISFWHEPDGSLAMVDPGRLAARAARSIATAEPDAVVTFGPEGTTGHPDHIAISHAVTTAWAEQSDTRLLYSCATAEWHQEFADLHRSIGLWLGEGEAPSGIAAADVVLDIGLTTGEIERKRQVLAGHESQTTAMASLMGEATYRRWWRREWFCSPTPAQVVESRRLAAGTVA